MAEIVVEASAEKLEEVLEFINGQLEERECSMKLINQVDLAVEEIYMNIANYAYNPVTGEANVRCEITENPLQVTIGFADSGTPYNPLERDDPDVTASAEDRRIGGLGVYLVKQLMDEIDYQFEDGKNVLTIKKTIGD